MKPGWLIALGFAGGIAVCSVGLRLRSVTADVPPAADGMYYAGELREGGAPAMGLRDIEVRFHSTDMGSGNQLCTSGVRLNTPLVDGHFRINVGSDCVAMLAAAPSAYVEVLVGGLSLPPPSTPRPRVAAVPYAVQAITATSLTGPLPAANVITVAGPSVEARLADLEARVAGVPPGTIVAFAGATAPPGWLICDGSEVSRTTFMPLFTAIGVAWGTGDNVSTFNVPDLRGTFLRGVDGGAGNDPDAAARSSTAGGNAGDLVGSRQDDALQNMTGTINGIQSLSSYGATGVMRASNNGFAANAPGGSPGFNVTFNAALQVRTSSETRPKNANVTFIIKT